MTLEVKLPVCDHCGRVGKLPASREVATFCTGPRGESHSRRRMRTVLFVAASEEAVAELRHDPPSAGVARRVSGGLREYACPECGGAVWRAPKPGPRPKCPACRAAA